MLVLTPGASRSPRQGSPDSGTQPSSSTRMVALMPPWRIPAGGECGAEVHISRLVEMVVATARACGSTTCRHSCRAPLVGSTPTGQRGTSPSRSSSSAQHLSLVLPHSSRRPPSSVSCAPIGAVRVSLSVTVPVSTLCPCSTAISDYGAHQPAEHAQGHSGTRLRSHASIAALPNKRSVPGLLGVPSTQEARRTSRYDAGLRQPKVR